MILRYIHTTIYTQGFHTHGPPTEKKAISALGIDRSKASISNFRDTYKKNFYIRIMQKNKIDGSKRLGGLAERNNV